MAVAAKKPKLTELIVSYSAGVKANLGKQTYESADFHISRTEKYNVEGLSDEAIDLFWSERYELLKEEIDELIVAIHAETSRI